MTKLKVIPIEPSPAFAKQLLKAKERGVTLRADGISITPPTKSRATWGLNLTFPILPSTEVQDENSQK